MTPPEIIYHRRVHLPALADELGNVSVAGADVRPWSAQPLRESLRNVVLVVNGDMLEVGSSRMPNPTTQSCQVRDRQRT